MTPLDLPGKDLPDGTNADDPIRRARKSRAAEPPATAPDNDSIATVDSSYLEGLLGYNARRATLTIIGLFLQRMSRYDLRPVDFSILSLITHNPGITSRQLCATLGILPPNLVGIVGTLDKRGLISRRRHRIDGRAMSLYLTRAGEQLMLEAESTAAELELDATPRLNAADRKTLMRLLQKIYL